MAVIQVTTHLIYVQSRKGKKEINGNLFQLNYDYIVLFFWGGAFPWVVEIFFKFLIKSAHYDFSANITLTPW